MVTHHVGIKVINRLGINVIYVTDCRIYVD